MKEITSVEEIKELLLNILLDVADFCEKNGIQYYLTYGTLLGAVRHQGFIPWDDDLDIMMPRDDYEKFIHTYSSARFKCVDVTSDENYFYPFAKVFDNSTLIQEEIIGSVNFGLYIDVFPIDGLPNNHTNSYLRNTVFLQKCMRNKYSPLNRPRNKIKQVLIHVTKLLLRPFSLHFLGKKIDKLAQRTNYAESELVGIIVWGYDYLYFDKNYLGDGIKLQFESHMFNVPLRYSELLTKTYGDYMKLPPEEKRTSGHGYKAFYI